MDEAKTVVVHIRLAPSQAKEMRLVARAEGTTPSELIRQLIRARAEVLSNAGR